MEAYKKEELKKVLPQKIYELLEVYTGPVWFSTRFDFKNAKLDKDFIWTLSIGIKDLPPRFYIYYTAYIYLDASPYNAAIESYINKFLDPQKSLLDTEENTFEEIKKIHESYVKETLMIWTYTFTTQLAKMENKMTKTLDFIVKLKDLQEIEKLHNQGLMHRLCLKLSHHSD